VSNQNETHIINKLLIDVELSQDQMPEHQRISREIKTEVLSALDAFDERTGKEPGDYIYRANRLIVDVDVDPNNLSDLSGLVEEALLKQLKPASITREHPSGYQSKDEKHSTEPDHRNLLQYFLKTGQFPWWTGSDFTVQDLENRLLELSPDEWQREITPLLRNMPAALNRVVIQFSEKSVRTLLNKSSHQKNISDAFLFLDEIDAFLWKFRADLTAGQILKIKRELYHILLLYTIDESLKKNDLMNRLTQIVIISIPQTIQTSEGTKPWIEWLKSSESSHAKRWLDRAKRTLSTIKPEETTWIRRGSDQQKQKTGDSLQRITNKRFGESEEIDVPQAGLVLLHPFIGRLFGNLGLLDKGAFPDEEKKERAVCLIHYLATGEEQFEEPRLALPMFLCSWPIGVPIERFLKISDTEKEECLKVLSSAVQHWTALKNTTSEGLRENFLRRNGRLKKGEFGWTLFVEKKTQDLLLEKLPWGISAVTFKWMKQLLTVHWRG
jgi:hypothetical protein